MKPMAQVPPRPEPHPHAGFTPRDTAHPNGKTISHPPQPTENPGRGGSWLLWRSNPPRSWNGPGPWPRFMITEDRGAWDPREPPRSWNAPAAGSAPGRPRGDQPAGRRAGLVRDFGSPTEAGPGDRLVAALVR